MRYVIGILATVGIVGLYFGLGAAEDRFTDYDPFAPARKPAAKLKKSDASATFISRNGKTTDQKNGPGEATPRKLTSTGAARRLGRPADENSVRTAGFEQSGDTRRSVTTAEYRSDGRRAPIRHVEHSEPGSPPFKTPAQIDAATREPRRVSVPTTMRRPSKRLSLTSPPNISPRASSTRTAATGSLKGEAPQVSVRWVKKSEITIGQECTCHLVVKNAGNAVAADVVLSATFPNTVRLSSAKPVPTVDGTSLTWKFDALAVGEETAIELKWVPSARGQLAARAQVRFSSAASGVFTVEEPQLKLAITGPDEVLIGDPASQIILVSNPGTGLAKNVTIEAVVPAGLEHSRGERLAMEVGSLQPGETRKVRLSLAAVAGGSQIVHVRAKALATLPQQLSKSVDVVAPSLKLAIDGPGLRYLGRNAAYTVNVTNDGSRATHNVRVVHRVPEGFKYLSADRGGKFDSSKRTVNWFVGRIEPGQTVPVRCQLASAKLGKHTHLVGAVSEEGGKAQASAATTIDGTASLVLEVVDLDDPVEVGIETAFDVRVRNEGTKAATNVAVSCELPAGLDLIEAKGPTTSATEKGLIVFRALGELPPGKTAVFRVIVRGKAAGHQRFRARLSSDSITEPLTTDELTQFYVD